MSEQTEGTKQRSTPSAEHKRLSVFVAGWKAEGTAFGDARSPENPTSSTVKWKREENYEWLTE
jgi:hypothetical protein